jgi:predicted nucleotidyltransferase
MGKIITVVRGFRSRGICIDNLLDILITRDRDKVMEKCRQDALKAYTFLDKFKSTVSQITDLAPA